MLPVRKAVMRGAAVVRYPQPQPHQPLLRVNSQPVLRVSIPPSAPLRRVVGFDLPPGSPGREDPNTAALVDKFF